jgi:two-component system sensor histidine kinase PilS (NtrC family)
MATAEHTLKGSASDFQVGASVAGDAYRRAERLLGAFRLLVTLALLGVSIVYRDVPVLGTRYPGLFLTTAAGYLLVAAMVLISQLRGPRTPPEIVLLEVLIDILAITLLMHASGGISSGIGGLLVVFVGGAGLSLRGQQAFLAAAIATIAVLAEQVLSYGAGLSEAGAFLPAGVLGGIIFIVTSAAHPLARRLYESEALAFQRGIDLANLAQLNDYIIQNLRESIVVVDGDDRLRLINQSAAEHLGATSRAPGQTLGSVSPELSRVLRGWRATGAGFNTTSSFLSADGTTQINTYIAPLERREDGPVLMFLEDAGLLAEKVQQTKLAALGRLSASIAHEIRNPVGAMSHAGQLLEESPAVGDDERRLLDIIKTNSRRVSEIVDNVLQLSRREATRPELISLAPWLHVFADEFISTLELFEGQIRVVDDEDIDVRIDPGHLRQICWNLCENSVKYASEAAGGIAVEIRYGRLPSNQRPYLEVVDLGPGIPAELRDQLFEPFSTGRAGGTGLGLFISRELCECNRATLIYEPRASGGSVFRIVFADPDRWGRNL